MHVIHVKVWGSSDNSEYIFIPLVDLRHWWNLPQQVSLHDTLLLEKPVSPSLTLSLFVFPSKLLSLCPVSRTHPEYILHLPKTHQN